MMRNFIQAVGLFGQKPLLMQCSRHHIRCLSDQVRSRQLNPYLEHVYHPSENPSRRLALIGTFLAWKPRYFKTLQKFYMDRGFDILYYKGEVKHILHPATAKQISEPMSESLLLDPMLRDREMLVHAFSVGVFFFGHSLVYMNRDVEKFEDVLSRVRGVIYDSPATIVRAPIGIAHSMTKNPVGIKLVTKIFEYFYWLMSDSVAIHGTRADETFAKNERGYPVLMMYSNSDIVSKGCAEKFVKKLEENRNAPIFSHNWDDTPHANLMRFHSDEYFALLEEFLRRTGLRQRESTDDERRQKILMSSRN